MTTRKQINTDAETYAMLAAFARELGYLQHGGPRSGEGSPVKLLEAIARGEVVLMQRKEHSDAADLPNE